MHRLKFVALFVFSFASSCGGRGDCPEPLSIPVNSAMTSSGKVGNAGSSFPHGNGGPKILYIDCTTQTASITYETPEGKIVETWQVQTRPRSCR